MRSPHTKAFPWSFVTSAMGHRRLIAQLVQREIQVRYRGTFLGIIWTLLSPILMLFIYTFVFSVVYKARWGSGEGTQSEFALVVFSSLLLFSILSESIQRAPGLVLGNVSYVKRIVFPLEILAWVNVLTVLVNTTISFLILLLFYFITQGPPPMTALLFPVIALPVICMSLGLSWFLASLSVFYRDVQQLTGPVTSVLLFLSPIFYPLSAVPANYQWMIKLTPLAILLEEARNVLFAGVLPDWSRLALLMMVGWIIAWVGYIWFTRTQEAFADVV